MYQKHEHTSRLRGLRAGMVALAVLVPTVSTVQAVVSPTAAYAGVNDDAI